MTLLHSGSCHAVGGRCHSGSESLGGQGRLFGGGALRHSRRHRGNGGGGGETLQVSRKLAALPRLGGSSGAREELYSVGAGDYATLDGARRNRLLAERVENLIANKTAQFIETHKRDGGSGAEAES